MFAAVVVVNGNATNTGKDELHSVVGLAKLDGCALLCRQFYTLFAKRFHNIRRSKKALLSQVRASLVSLKLCCCSV